VLVFKLSTVAYNEEPYLSPSRSYPTPEPYLRTRPDNPQEEKTDTSNPKLLKIKFAGGTT